MPFSSNKNCSDPCFVFFYCMKNHSFLVLKENVKFYVSIEIKPIIAYKTYKGYEGINV